MRSELFSVLSILLFASQASLTVHSSPPSERSRTALMGYADRLSVQPG